MRRMSVTDYVYRLETWRLLQCTWHVYPKRMANVVVWWCLLMEQSQLLLFKVN